MYSAKPYPRDPHRYKTNDYSLLRFRPLHVKINGRETVRDSCEAFFTGVREKFVMGGAARDSRYCKKTLHRGYILSVHSGFGAQGVVGCGLDGPKDVKAKGEKLGRGYGTVKIIYNGKRNLEAGNGRSCFWE